MAVVESSTNDDILIDKVGAFFIFAEVLNKHAVNIRNMLTLKYVIAQKKERRKKKDGGKKEN